MQSSTHFSLTQTFLVYLNRDLSINLPSSLLVRCDDSWVIGFWRCKRLNLNVQLYIYSFILFKLSDSWQSGLNISYTIKNPRVTQISQRGLNELKTSKCNCNWNKRTVEWFNKNLNWIWDYTMLSCIRTSFKPSKLLYAWHWQLLDLNSFDCAKFCIMF